MGNNSSDLGDEARDEREIWRPPDVSVRYDENLTRLQLYTIYT